MSAKLAEKNPGWVVPEDSENILSLFAQREELDLLSQSRLDPNPRHCDD
jgi:hypothetical protein